MSKSSQTSPTNFSLTLDEKESAKRSEERYWMLRGIMRVVSLENRWDELRTLADKLL